MVFSENAESFGGKTIADYDPESPLPDPTESIPRVRVDFDAETSAVEMLQRLLADPAAEQLTGLVIGMWDGEMMDAGPDELVELLCASSDQLPNLRSLFIGDVTFEECEVSWMNLTDLSPLWDAFPRLEILKIRGSQGLSLGKIRHRHLKELYLESGGLGTDVLEQVIAAELPELEVLSVYLGSSSYGWDGTIEDVMPLIEAKQFPKLKSLGLCDSELADEIAQAIANAPILDRLEVLDLSQGIISDVGAEALLASPKIRKLKKLDLTHHYISDANQARLLELPLEVLVGDAQDGDDPDDRYVAVGE